MTAWVQRYTLHNLLDDSFDLFKERATALLLAGLLPVCLVVIYVAVMRTFVIQGNLMPHFDTIPQGWDAFLALWEMPPFQHFILGLAIVAEVALSLSLTAQARIALYHALGEDCSIWKAFRLMAKPFFSQFVITQRVFELIMTVTTLVAFVIVALLAGLVAVLVNLLQNASEIIGMIVAIVGVTLVVFLSTAIFLFVGTLFLTTTVFLAYDHTGPFKALSRSFASASSNMKTHFSALYVITHLPAAPLTLVPVVAALLYLPVQAQAPQIDSIIIMLLVMLFFSAGFTGLLSCLQALVYIDGRCRTEALDLQLMAAEIGLGDEVAAAFQPKRAAPATAYPNYSGQPAGPAAGYPDYTSLPGRAPAGYPDYSQPPAPAPFTAPVNLVKGTPTTRETPDYSQPPPVAAPVGAAVDYAQPPPVMPMPDYTQPPPAHETPAAEARETLPPEVRETPIPATAASPEASSPAAAQQGGDDDVA